MTNKIIISDITIHKDAQGRYSLNDLHQASGNEEKDKPANWLRLEKTVELIDEILNAQIRAFKPVDSRKGRYGGTYVCKELVYSYAMWISAAFALKVIRAYDALVSDNAEVKPRVRQCTATQLTPLRQTAERLITTGLGKIYPDIWKLVRQRFDVEHIHQLQPEQVGEAIEYLKALEGEYIKRKSYPVEPIKQFTDSELCSLCWLWNAAEYMRDMIEKIHPALEMLNSNYATSFDLIALKYKGTLEEGRALLDRETKSIIPHPHDISDENWRRVLPRLRQSGLSV
ncbi:TPA: DNA-binding protein [Salmonella enterica]|uniref:DNA-binding protein n=1 Tax=Salmonella enterica TaxID=28901 RepID=A0A743Z402_SALER|nr:DNA-binding protein [Salmonella enterica]EII9563905.1 KilA-N domain-containing protein [Salmonella enterica]EJP5374491.1 KilA-N domain-containing protein [Salmonella enterica]HAF2208040.1 DNA-binding protein [Salmonella enterica]